MEEVFGMLMASAVLAALAYVFWPIVWRLGALLGIAILAFLVEPANIALRRGASERTAFVFSAICVIGVFFLFLLPWAVMLVVALAWPFGRGGTGG